LGLALLALAGPVTCVRNRATFDLYGAASCDPRCAQAASRCREAFRTKAFSGRSIQSNKNLRNLYCCIGDLFRIIPIRVDLAQAQLVEYRPRDDHVIEGAFGIEFYGIGNPR